MFLVFLVSYYLSVFLCPWSKSHKPFKYAAWDCIKGCIRVCTSFIKVLKFLIFFPMDLEFQFSFSIPKKFKIEVREFFLLYPIRHLVYFSAGLRLVSKVHTRIVSIHGLRVCLPYFGNYPSIFLYPKAISYPWILTIYCLCISLPIWLPWIDCCILKICKMLPGPQENLIRIRLLLGLLFQYISNRIQNIYLKISVGLSSSQTRWFSGTIW